MTPSPSGPTTPIAETAQQVARQAGKVTESAQHLEVSADAIVDSADQQMVSAERRTILAADRTVLAAERTYAAWMRTGMAALAGGAAVRPLFESRWSHWTVLFTATALLLFAVFCFLAGVWRQLQTAPAPPVPDMKRLPAWALIIGAAALMLAALAALVEIWVFRR